MQMRRNGFTIVELTIVITVIGILAAISIVAYNGIQTRARNNQTFSAVRTYYRALITYKSDNGTYPALSTETVGSCLGTNYSPNKCALLTLNNVHQDAQVNNALKQYISESLPMPSQNRNGNWSGVWLLPATASSPFTLDGVRTSFLIYAIEGSNSTCEVGPVASSKIVNGNQSGFEFLSTEPANKRTLEDNLATPTCWIPLTR